MLCESCAKSRCNGVFELGKRKGAKERREKRKEGEKERERKEKGKENRVSEGGEEEGKWRSQAPGTSCIRGAISNNTHKYMTTSSR
jgi:hypothetical protein